jgi:hypothetical protein
MIRTMSPCSFDTGAGCQVILILKHDSYPDDIYICPEFLDKLDNPSRKSPCDILQVQYWCVPVEGSEIAIDMSRRLGMQCAAT